MICLFKQMLLTRDQAAIIVNAGSILLMHLNEINHAGKTTHLPLPNLPVNSSREVADEIT